MKTMTKTEIAIAEDAFRTALRAGDTAKDAFLYGQLMVESVRLAAS